MTSPQNTKARNTLVAAGVVSIMFGAMGVASAQQQGGQQAEIPEGWFKACTKQEDVDICNVQNIMVSDSGQLLTGVSMIELEGQVNRRVFQITVPPGRMLPPGIGLQVDGGQSQKVDYMICLPDRCIAEVALNDDLVNRFKRGQQVTLTSINFQNQQNPIQISLAGFTQAYDGPPMQQSDIEARQQQLEEFVNRNTEDFARKLREEQERARQQSRGN